MQPQQFLLILQVPVEDYTGLAWQEYGNGNGRCKILALGAALIRVYPQEEGGV